MGWRKEKDPRQRLVELFGNDGRSKPAATRTVNSLRKQPTPATADEGWEVRTG